MYISKHYDLQELVYPELYMEYHDLDKLWILWRKFDDRFLKTSDQIRKDFGVTYLNTWIYGKISIFFNQVFYYSCVRPNEIPDGQVWAEDTSHKDFNTGDFKVEKYALLSRNEKLQAYDDMRQFIIDNPKLYPYVTAIESGQYAPTWCHLTTGNFRHADGSIRIIKP